MAKDSSRTSAGELQKIVASQSQKTLKQLSNSIYIPTCCLGGLQEKFSKFIQKQTSAYSVIRRDWSLKWDWLLWSDETTILDF